MKTATTIEEQITKLRQRGLKITDENKTKEILLDIGYYRLGFYWFPYEKDYPNWRRVNRTHLFNEGANIENVIKLYYFDKDLRNILAPYLFRIEVHFRTQMIYWLSNKYKENPTWFADVRYIDNNFANHLKRIYDKYIKTNASIKHHHKIHTNDLFAPAWKTIEYFTLGDIISLYNGLKNEDDKLLISRLYNINPPEILSTYMSIIRILRNLCAHGHNLFDLRLQKSIPSKHLKIVENDCGNLVGALKVVLYFLKHISINRSEELKQRIQNLIDKEENNSIKDIVSYINRAL